MSTSVLKALSGKLDIKRHLPSILYLSIEFRGGLCRGAVENCRVPEGTTEAEDMKVRDGEERSEKGLDSAVR